MKDCAVVVGVPLRDGQRPPSLKRAEAAFVESALDEISELGVRVFRDANLDDIRAAGAGHVVAFVAHHDQEQGIQFGDTFIEVDVVLHTLGAAYRGTVDIAICFARLTVVEHLLRIHCPRARGVLFEDQHELTARVSILRATFRVLAGLLGSSGSMPETLYVETLACVLKEMERN